MLHFYGIGEPEPKNFFGMLDYLHQPTTPKYEALMDYLGSKVTYIPPQKAYVPPPPVARAPARPGPAAVQQPVNQLPPPVTTRRTRQRSAFDDVWDEFLGEESTTQAVQTNTRVIRPKTTAPTNSGVNTGIVGPGINGWIRRGNTATSPPISLRRGINHKLSILWRLENVRRLPSEYFRIYAIDANGGRKLLLNQAATDIAEVGSYDQLYEEDFNRYIGPPIRLMLETSPGLRAFVSKISY